MNKPKSIVPISDAEDAMINRAAATDPDVRPLTDGELSEFRPAAEILPQLLGKRRAESLMSRRGRPALPADERKVSVSMRYDRDLIEAFKATGHGWQTRMNEVLRAYAKSHRLLPRSR